jgi:protein SCO1/2
MTNTIGELYELYRPSDKVRFLSITVDPEYDTPEILQRYADSVGVDDRRWQFAHGPISEIQTLIEKGFLLDASELPAGHPARLVLIDQFGQIRGYYSYDDEADLQLLRQHVRQLAREL